mmetsp:Transcript_115757/g.300131  ORF Transcript_115757/g.300131 Transcript_115757/m.300131 type:complete len:84 (-) Transcript_115757:10-261(-)
MEVEVTGSVGEEVVKGMPLKVLLLQPMLLLSPLKVVATLMLEAIRVDGNEERDNNNRTKRRSESWLAGYPVLPHPAVDFGCCV